MLSHKGSQSLQQHQKVPHLQSTVCSPLTSQLDSQTASHTPAPVTGRIHRRRMEGGILCILCIKWGAQSRVLKWAL